MTKRIKNNQEIVVRMAEETDFSAILALRASYLSYLAGYKPIVEPQDYSTNSLLCVAISDTAVVGSGRIDRLDAGYNYQLTRIVTSQKARKSGIGRAIVKYLEDYTDGKLSTIILKSKIENLEFYRKCGYGYLGGTFEENGIKYRRMYKKLYKEIPKI